MAKKRGAFVIGTASTPEKRELAHEAGADESSTTRRQDFAAETKRITEARCTRRVRLVGKTTFDKSLDCSDAARHDGALRPIERPVPPFDPQILNRKGSLFLTRPTLNATSRRATSCSSRANDLFGWIASGELSVRIGAEFPLDRAGDAHRALAGRETTGKVLLVS